MFFYTYFPEVLFEDKLILNITKRFTVLKELLSDTDSIIEYEMKDWDTPESIARVVYGHDRYSWLVLLINWALSDNPFCSFYRSNQELLEFCKEKYGVHLFEISFLKDSKLNIPLDEVDSFYYFNQPLKLRDKQIVPITLIDHESERNEQVKVIRLIPPQFLEQIENELKSILFEEETE